MTEYVILAENEDATWAFARRIEARSARSAIRNYLIGSSDVDTRYVAIPERSWQPLTVAVETKQTLKFS